MSGNQGGSSFGELLRIYRERCIDRRSRKLLSQGSLARKLLDKRGLIFDRNTIGKWEANRRIIPADDRRTLTDLLAILVEYGGITTSEEANLLLEAGYYRKLDEQEKFDIHPGWKGTRPAARVMRGDEALPDDAGIQHPIGSIPPQAQSQRKVIPPSLEDMVLKSWGELETILAATKDGPQPSWPRVLVGLSRGVLDRWTTARTLKALLWLWLWLLTWLLIAPSLRWPFAGQEEAVLAMVIYAAGTLLIPLFIATLIQPKNNKFWQEQKLATNKVFYLYVYQGAGIGFHLGYFAAFLMKLLGYHFHLPSAIWSELLIVLFPLGLSYVAAQLVPFNLWRAYGRLNLTDGGIFFVFLILGPIWGYFFLNIYATFLIPVVGLTVVLLAATSLAAAMAWRQRQTGATLIPAHWWSLFYGSILILYEISVGEDWYAVASLAGLILVFSGLMALKRIHITIVGLLGLLAAIVLLLVILEFNIWAGRILTTILLLIWWLWGKRFLSFPSGFWVFVLIIGVCGWGSNQGLFPEIVASTAVAISSLLTLLWERHRKLGPQLQGPQ